MKINVTRSSMPEFSEYCEEIKDLWDTRWLTNMGSKHREFQRKLESYLQVKNIDLVTNGHMALGDMYAGVGLKRRSNYHSVYVCVYDTCNCEKWIIACICDINPQDFTIDVSKIEALITNWGGQQLCLFMYMEMYVM